jgi:hypothetical protein
MNETQSESADLGLAINDSWYLPPMPPAAWAVLLAMGLLVVLMARLKKKS